MQSNCSCVNGYPYFICFPSCIDRCIAASLSNEILDNVGVAENDIAIFSPSHCFNHKCAACPDGLNRIMSILCGHYVADATWKDIAGAVLRMHRILDTSISNMNMMYHAESYRYCLLMSIVDRNVVETV